MGCGTKLERITSTFIYEQRSSRSFYKSIHWFSSSGFIVILFFSPNGIYVDFYGQKFIYEAVNGSCYHGINHILLPFCANFCFKYWKNNNAKSYIVCASQSMTEMWMLQRICAVCICQNNNKIILMKKISTFIKSESCAQSLRFVRSCK